MTLTKLELEVLETVKSYQNEEGHSDFLSTQARTKSVAGVLSSLQKKGFIYDSYDYYTKDDWAEKEMKKFKMWCFTTKAAELVGKPFGWQ